jgi:hypothetical protein
MRNTAGLCKRLEKLEANLSSHNPWSFDVGRVQAVALSKLSAADRDRLAEVYGVLGQEDFTEEQRGIWDRWEAALQAAFRETGSPISFPALLWEWWDYRGES